MNKSILHISSSFALDTRIAVMENLSENNIFMAAETGELEAWCMEHELLHFPWRVGYLSLLSNAGLLRRICKNYKVDEIRVYDSASSQVVNVAKWFGKLPVVLNCNL